MASTIHPTAVIAEGAKIGADVFIGPYCVVGAQVTLGDRVRLVSHVAVDGETTIGDDTEIFPFASIGHRPQDKKFKGENSRLVIGKRNVIREHVTMNPGTEGGGLITQVGDDCLFMASTHVAHDCIIGNHVILANHATLAGHVHVGNGVGSEEFVAMRENRDATLSMPALLLPAVQVNMRAGEFPPVEDNGVSYLKLPINLL